MTIRKRLLRIGLSTIGLTDLYATIYISVMLSVTSIPELKKVLTLNLLIAIFQVTSICIMFFVAWLAIT